MFKTWSLILAILMMGGLSQAQARRVKTKVNVETIDTTQMSRGTFVVTDVACDTCNSGYNLSQLTFTGYDKPLSASCESFFITNNTDCELVTVSLDIEYLTVDLKQLHKRFERIQCLVPPGQTRKIDIKSWDKQNSFYYHLSAKPRRQATPYVVRIIPVSCNLRFK